MSKALAAMENVLKDCDIVFAPSDPERLALGMRHLSALKARGIEVSVALLPGRRLADDGSVEESLSLMQGRRIVGGVVVEGGKGTAVAESLEELVSATDSLVGQPFGSSPSGSGTDDGADGSEVGSVQDNSEGDTLVGSVSDFSEGGSVIGSPPGVSPFDSGGDEERIVSVGDSSYGASPPGSGVEGDEVVSEGGLSSHFSVCIDMGKMNSVVEVSPESLLVEVEGGAMWRDVRIRLDAAGLYFPHWQGSNDEDATVAELLTRNEPVRFEFGYGSMRESVLSLEVVTPGGVLIRSGSKAVKDVSGYELIPFVMQYGPRCGVIVRAVLKLFPMPERRLFFAASGDKERIERAARIVERVTSPAFLEVLTGSALERLTERIMPGCGTDGERHLLLGCMEGLEAVVEARLKRLYEELGADDAGMICTTDERGEAVQYLDSLLYEVLDGGKGVASIFFDGGASSEGVSEALSGGDFVIVRALPHGRITVYLPFDEEAIDALRRTGFVERVEIAKEVDGALERTISTEGAAGGDSAIGRIAEEVLRRFDPYGIMVK